MKRLWICLMTLLILIGSAAAEETDQMTLLAINVGKADSLLLEYQDAAYLIDTGTAESWGALSAALRVCGIRRLTGVILTHTHKDHAGGAFALAQSGIQVDAWYSSAWYTDVNEKKHPAVLAAAVRGQEVQWLRSGASLPFGDGSLQVLGPLEADEKENNNSVVLLAQAEGASFLLAGDMEFTEEYSLLDAELIPRCDVLKVGNHGNADATSPELAAAVKPAWAILSTNTAEKPDSPAPRVIKLLDSLGSTILQTQDHTLGVAATASAGQIDVHGMALPELPEAAENVIVSDKSVSQDVVCVRNNGTADVDLSGWFIRSEKGNEIFVFPEGSYLAAGQEITISSLSSEQAGDLVWPDKTIWNKSKPDAALLYDAYGRLMDSDS